MSDLNSVTQNVWEKELQRALHQAVTTATGNNGYGTITVGRVGSGSKTGLVPNKNVVLGTDEHHDRLFWKYLVPAGWRRNITDADGWAGAAQAVLCHDKCGKILDTHAMRGMSNEQAEIFGSTGYVTKLIAKHKASGNCKPIEDEEETIAEGTVKVSLAEPTMIYNNGHWVAVI